jgi:DNA-directed RNA polymerase specialized sigma24 family protein
MNNNQDNQILRKALQSIAMLKKARLADLEKIAEIERTLDSLSNPKSNAICQNCSKRDTCIDLCDQIIKEVPKEHQGYHSNQHNYGDLIENIGCAGTKNNEEDSELLHKYDLHYLDEIDRVRSDDIFVLYKNCIHLFSKKEWRVITLRVEEGLSFKEIGSVLGIKGSSASDTFYRAQKRMERHHKNIQSRK